MIVDLYAAIANVGQIQLVLQIILLGFKGLILVVTLIDVQFHPNIVIDARFLLIVDTPREVLITAFSPAGVGVVEEEAGAEAGAVAATGGRSRRSLPVPAPRPTASGDTTTAITPSAAGRPRSGARSILLTPHSGTTAG